MKSITVENCNPVKCMTLGEWLYKQFDRPGWTYKQWPTSAEDPGLYTCDDTKWTWITHTRNVVEFNFRETKTHPYFTVYFK